jgi:hypothetical protein
MQHGTKLMELPSPIGDRMLESAQSGNNLVRIPIRSELKVLCDNQSGKLRWNMSERSFENSASIVPLGIRPLERLDDRIQLSRESIRRGCGEAVDLRLDALCAQ